MAVGSAPGEDTEELLDDRDMKEGVVGGREESRKGPLGSSVASQPAASLGNSYVVNLATLGIREVAFVVTWKGGTCISHTTQTVRLLMPVQLSKKGVSRVLAGSRRSVPPRLQRADAAAVA